MEAAVDHCDAMVSIDADLQDDENVIVDMVRQVQDVYKRQTTARASVTPWWHAQR